MNKIILALLLLTFSSSLCFAKVVKEYFPDGKIYTVQVYNEQGEITGPYKVFYPNGRLRSKTWYRDGQPYATKRWDINGHAMATVQGIAY
jgi:antitoxin component YwqK of YwqJK toxin-antitoxin module